MQQHAVSSFRSPSAGRRLRVELFSIGSSAEAGWKLQALRWLGAEERSYGATFARPEDRERFLASRYHLRTALEAFTGVGAGRWHFRRNAEGRWTSVTDAGGEIGRVSFSVAHSGGIVAVALADGLEVGIDLEPRRNYPLEADAAWTDAERAALRRLPSALRPLAELRLWTAKEAYLKLLGRGAFADFATVDLAERPPLTTRFRFGSTLFANTRYDACVAYRDPSGAPLQLEIPTWLEEDTWKPTA